MKRSPDSAAFALIATLAVLALVVVLITAFVVVMRTERVASHNYVELQQGRALAQTVLNRVLADQAGTIPPYEVDPATRLPTAKTVAVYNAVKPEAGIFRMEPQADVSTANNLVRLSRAKGGSGARAYAPKNWAYLRFDDPAYGDTFLPKDSDGQPTAPDWIDYYPVLPSGSASSVPTGQIAFAIWEEGGKLDINTAGADPAINGMAPHDLGLETDLSGTSALTWLNGDDGLRQRSNFSQRKISTNTAITDTGDDRRFFSIEEALRKEWVTPENALKFTTFSRDFDVRPEWDGNRKADRAKAFLRSYVNNPDIYKLMLGAGGVGPKLVKDTLNEQTLKAALPPGIAGSADEDSWMQIKRLLATLRLSLPPFISNPGPASPTAAVPYAAVPPNAWFNEDIWGIALNIAQASDSASDENLIAKDAATSPAVQANMRYGIRLSPLITEVAFKVEYDSPGKVKVTEYIEIWNPYGIDLSGNSYLIGETSGGAWPSIGNSLYAQSDSANNRVMTTGPAAGAFKVVNLPTKSGMTLSSQSGEAKIGTQWGLIMRMSAYLTDKGYYDGTTPWNCPCSRGAGYSGAGDVKTTDYRQMAWIPPEAIPKAGDPAVWYSMQIDDPRMGPSTRYSPTTNWKKTWTGPGDGDQLGGDWKYTWQGYFNRHSLAGITDSAKVLSTYGDGYNINFGESWPSTWPKDSAGLRRALATFGLPGRPLRNIGELGTVFAFRPWRTLSFARTTAPEDSTLTAGAAAQNWPATLLDYLTTVGTTSENTGLNYRQAGTVAPANTQFIGGNVNARKQDMAWLFDGDNSAVPAGSIRPIHGRVNLNTASQATLATLIKAPYRMVNSLGVKDWPGLSAKALVGSSDLKITIAPADATDLARAIDGIRPLRSLADLAKLGNDPKVQALYTKYPESVMDAMMGRLAQFGSIRQQIYTVDIMARTLNPEAKARGRNVITSEVRLLARVYFDTFSRQGFVESTEYR